VRTTLESVNAKTGAAENTMADLRQTLDKARETLSNLAENTEALKHNWFFSGFFKHRGYFSLSDLSAADYLRGALEQGGRVALRVWLGSDVLFTSLPDGTLALTSDGKARLDSAIADFLNYRGSGPIVIEGYAQNGTPAERILDSRQRAALARDYLLDRFHLTPESTGLMPLGDKSVGSPGGKKWDGVAIAMFVEKKTLRESDKRAK
jgi:phospholipid/cholesterol/gamma-HCH transport system substrate-binding protein